MELEYGAEVIDKDGKVVGKINYIIRDTYTGDIRKFKVGTDLADTDLFYSPEDILEFSATQVKLKVPFDKPSKE